MKAWYLSIKGDEDQGTVTVFANTRNEARSYADSHDLFYDSWIDIVAVRAKQYDDMEKTPELVALDQWHGGWRWFDIEYPDPDEATDEEFLKWYKETFEKSP